MSTKELLHLKAIDTMVIALSEYAVQEREYNRKCRLHTEIERLQDAIERASDVGDLRKSQLLTLELLEIQQMLHQI